MKKYFASIVVVAFAGLVGCQDKGPVTKAGERVDEVIDNVKHGDAPFKEKGTAEKVGESIDESIGK